MISKKLIISGKVQGVAYRYHSKLKADNLGLKGWVRNSDDGSVTAEIIGSSSQIDSFIEWCNEGPDLAIVKEVIVLDCEYKDYASFSILR